MLEKLNSDPINIEELFYKVLRENERFIDTLPKYQVLSAVQTLETYQQHKMNTTSYLFLHGGKDSGKTVLLLLHKYLDYRPLLSPSLPAADVYSYIGFHEEVGATILEDEAERLDKEYEKLKIYKTGYQRGQDAPRIIDASGIRTMRFYKTFGCKMFAGTRLPKSETFVDRCILVPMVHGENYVKSITTDLDKSDYERFNDIKVKLLAWRMQTYWESLPSVDLNKGRVKELWQPKLQIANLVMGNSNVLMEMANEERDKRIREVKESLEAQICKAVIVTCNAENVLEVSFSDIWDAFTLVVDGKVTYNKDGVVSANKILTDNYGTVSKWLVGKRLIEIFGGQKRLLKGKGRVYLFKKELLEKLLKKYLVEEKLWKQKTLLE